MNAGGCKTVSAAVKLVTQEIADQHDTKTIEFNRSKSIAETITLHHSTVAELHNLMDQASVDAVITSPPNDARFLPVFSDLADFAAHALKPEGVMVVMPEVVHLPEVFERLKHRDLRWVSEFDYRHGSPPVYTGEPHRLNSFRRPLLIYGKSRCRLRPGDDFIEVPHSPGDRRSQRLDAGMELVVARFARPGQVVCDPVLLDRASIALAARKQGCLFVGAFDDQSCIRRVWDKLKRAEQVRGDTQGPGS